MNSVELRKHINQRVKIRTLASPAVIPGVVTVVDDATLKLRTLVAAPGRLQLRSEEIDIPCNRIVSIVPEQWQ